MKKRSEPKGCMVIVDAEHLCMSMGIKESPAKIVSLCSQGHLQDKRNRATREETLESKKEKRLVRRINNMSLKIISGTDRRTDQGRGSRLKEVAALKGQAGSVLYGLVTRYLVAGRNPASSELCHRQTGKQHELGFHSIQDDQPEDISKRTCSNFHRQSTQQGPEDTRHPCPTPLPKDILMRKKVLNAIDPDKDVDGFSPCQCRSL